MALGHLIGVRSAQPKLPDRRQKPFTCSVIEGNEGILAVGDSHPHHLIRTVSAKHSSAGRNENAKDWVESEARTCASNRRIPPHPALQNGMA